MRQSSNISESAHSILWRYCPKDKKTTTHSMRAAITLTVLHINKGRRYVAKFLEELGFSIGNLEFLYQKLDEESLKQSQYKHVKYRKGTKNKDQEHYSYGGITTEGKEI